MVAFIKETGLWLVDHPVAMTLVIVSLQTMIIAVSAWLGSRICRGRSSFVHRLWLTAVVLVLSLLPAHFFVGGWHIRVLNFGSTNARLAADGEPDSMVDSRDDEGVPGQMLPQRAATKT